MIHKIKPQQVSVVGPTFTAVSDKGSPAYVANDVTEFCFDGVGMNMQSIEKMEIKHASKEYVPKMM